MNAAARIRVHGAVQGVGYRYFTQRRAHERNLRGWVRNMEDGSVLVHAEGSPSDLDSFVEELRRGPRFSRVTSVDVESVSATEGYTDFVIAGEGID